MALALLSASFQSLSPLPTSKLSPSGAHSQVGGFASPVECFFFNSVVVGLPYSLIFCHFWLFLVLKLLSFWLCKEAQCVYPRLHLGWKSPVFFSEFYSFSSYVRPLIHFQLIFVYDDVAIQLYQHPLLKGLDFPH